MSSQEIKELASQLYVFELQNREFDAVGELVNQYRRVCATPVVDDDYPAVRHDYEGALAALLQAMKDNRRFQSGNRYGLQEV